MRPRPQPSRARGLLRATVVVIGLTILLVIAIVVVSSLTAPTAKAPGQATPLATAPAVPASPGPSHLTPVPGRGTPILPKPHKNVTALPRATVAATHAVKKDVALGLQLATAGAEDKVAPLRHRTGGRPRIALPRWFTKFGAGGDAYQGRSLLAIDRRTGRRISAGIADPYVTPVWSADLRYLLYVRVRETNDYPGAAWTLVRFDRTRRQLQVLAVARGMGLWPLGWAHGSIYYAISNATDTSIFRIAAGRSRFVSILVPQPVSLPTLSPTRSFVSFFTPSDCTYCTLGLFDLNQLTTWNGPSGIPNERDVAWTPDGRTAVTLVAGRLAGIDTATHDTRFFRLPPGLRATWMDRLTADVVGTTLVLVDTVTAKTYYCPPLGSG